MRLASALACAALAACAAVPAQKAASPSAPGIALRNAGFEEPLRPGARCPDGWACTMHADPNSFRFVADAASAADGVRSLCIERVTPEPWAVISQSVQAESLRCRRLRFSIAMRGEGLGGPGGGPWLLVNGATGVLLHQERVSLLGSAWERRIIEFQVPGQAQAVEIGATLQGAGRLCIDDARLEPV